MFCENEDGAAIVSHIPISPFVPLQHNKIDVSTVNRLANFSIRFAREHGWCSTPSPQKTYGHTPGGDGGLNWEQNDVTVFYAGGEVELAESTPRFTAQGTPATLLLYAQLWLSHVGASSNGLYGKLFCFEKGEEGRKEPLGTFKLMGVTVSQTTRRPSPIPAPLLGIMRALLLKNSKAEELPKVERINLTQLSERCHLTAVRSEEEFNATLPSHPVAAPLRMGYRCEFRLRTMDFDFNKHVNQGVTIAMVIDAFRSAVADTSTVFPRLLDNGVHPLESDLLVRRFRIDYVREIPAGHFGTAVMLFLDDNTSRENIIASSELSRKKCLAEIWFLVQGIPADGGDPFVSAVGKMAVHC